MNYFLKTTELMGRGLYCAYNGIAKDEIIMECEVLVLDDNDTKTVNNTSLKYYTFKYDTNRDCIVLGNGEIFNHADTPNVAYRLVDFDGRKVMQFYAICNIEHNEQLFIDYTDDIKVTNTSEYLKQRSLLS